MQVVLHFSLNGHIQLHGSVFLQVLRQLK